MNHLGADSVLSSLWSPACARVRTNTRQTSSERCSLASCRFFCSGSYRMDPAISHCTDDWLRVWRCRVTCCSRSKADASSIRELARESRWATVGLVRQVWGRTGTKGALTINYMRAGCRLMLKDDLASYMAAARALVHDEHKNPRMAETDIC